MNWFKRKRKTDYNKDTISTTPKPNLYACFYCSKDLSDCESALHCTARDVFFCRGGCAGLHPHFGCYSVDTINLKKVKAAIEEQKRTEQIIESYILTPEEKCDACRRPIEDECCVAKYNYLNLCLECAIKHPGYDFEFIQRCPIGCKPEKDRQESRIHVVEIKFGEEDAQDEDPNSYVNSLHQAVEIKDNFIGELKLALNEKAREIEALKGTIISITNELKDANDKNLELAKKITELDDRLNMDNASLRRVVKSLQKENEKLEGKLSLAASTERYMADQINSLMEHNGKLEKDNEILQKDIEFKCNANREMRAEKDMRSGVIADLKNQIKTLQNKLFNKVLGEQQEAKAAKKPRKGKK